MQQVFNVTIGDNTYEVTTGAVDIFRAEKWFGMSASRVWEQTVVGLPIAQVYYAMKRQNLGNVPDDFDQFLDWAPDVELKIEEQDAPKESSDPAPSTSNSATSPSNQDSRSATSTG